MAKRVIDVVIPSAMWGPRILGGMMNLEFEFCVQSPVYERGAGWLQYRST